MNEQTLTADIDETMVSAPQNVVTEASTGTGTNLESTNLESMKGVIDALNRSQAVIEFEPDGTILTANENFLGALGYTLDEIKGQHHSMFVEAKDASSAAYTKFWEDLRNGEFQAAEYKRIGKAGKEIWI